MYTFIDFLDEICEAVKDAPPPVRHYLNEEYPTYLKENHATRTTPGLIAQVSSINKDNHTAYFRSAVIIRPNGSTLVGNRSVLVLRNGEFHLLWSLPHETFHPAPLAETKEWSSPWNTWLMDYYEKQNPFSGEYDTAYTVHNYSLNDSHKDLKKVSAWYADEILKDVLDSMQQSKQSAARLRPYSQRHKNSSWKAPTEYWQDAFTERMTETIAAILFQQNEMLLQQGGPQLLGLINENPDLSLEHYTIAARGHTALDRRRRLALLTSPFGCFLDLNTLDRSSLVMLERAEKEENDVANAVASVLGVDTGILHDLIDRSPPKSCHSQLMASISPHANDGCITSGASYWRALTKGISLIDQSHWPQDEDEWRAFFRVHEALDYFDELLGDNLPFSTADTLAALASHHHTMPEIRWLDAETRLLGFNTTWEIHTRRNGSTHERLRGPYWRVDVFPNGVIEQSVYYMTKKHIANKAYHALYRLQGEDAVNHLTTLVETGVAPRPHQPSHQPRRRPPRRIP